MSRKSKPIVFTERENYLLQWGESQDKPFGTYIKDLMREDYKKRCKDIPQEQPKQEIQSNGVIGDKAKKAYKNIIGD